MVEPLACFPKPPGDDIPDDKRAILKECGLNVGKRIGHGSFATVYEAVFMEGSLSKKEMEEQKKLVVTHDKAPIHENLKGKKVAIKWMEYKYKTAQMIMKEAQTMDELQHPNITKIIEAIWFVPEGLIRYFQTQEDNTLQEIRVDPRPDPFVPTEGRRFQPSPNDPRDAPYYQVAIVMELADFGDMLTWCDKITMSPPQCRKLSPSEYIDFCKGLRDGLDALHQTGRVHKDLNMGNVLVFKHNGDGVIGKLSDFGLVGHSSDSKERQEDFRKMNWVCQTAALHAVDLPPDEQQRNAKFEELKKEIEKIFFK